MQWKSPFVLAAPCGTGSLDSRTETRRLVRKVLFRRPTDRIHQRSQIGTHMKLFRAGEKSKGVCEQCTGIVDATFHYRDVPFSDGSGVVKDILALVCDTCDEVIAIPAQSTPAIKAARETAAAG